MSTIVLDGEVYDVIPAEVNAATTVLINLYKHLGRPTSPLTVSGEKMMNTIIAVWQDLYPREAAEWIRERTEYKRNEKSIREQVHTKTGRSLASMPAPIYNMYKKFFTDLPLNKRDNWIKLIQKYPIFQFVNKI